MRAMSWMAALATLAVTAPVAAQDLTFHGQVRPRYEFRDPSGGGKDESTSMRVRFAVEAALDANVSIFAQFQDVRLFGEETNTLGDFRADNFDLHQGWIRYRGQKLDWMTTTIGRMETNFGGQRLVGAVGWTQQGRSFDGVRVDLAPDWGTVAFVGYKLGDETAPAVAVDAELFGGYATIREVGPGALDLYWLYNRVEGAVETDQHSLGGRYSFTGALTGRFEGTVQTGTRGGTDVSAYMFGGRLGKGFADGKATATLWYDYVSGDNAATANQEAFHTLFPTNHKFYGFADLFLNLPRDTGGAGLQDMAVKLALKPTATVGLNVDLHSFRAARQGSLTSAHFADELDVTLSHKYTSSLTAVLGFSYVFQDDALAEIGRLSEDMTWVYVMLTAIF